MPLCILGERLAGYETEGPLVLALPRGGVPIGVEVARRLHAPVDVMVVRKLGAPKQPELAIGAIGPGGSILLDNNLIESLQIDANQLNEIVARERLELARRQHKYRGELPPLDLIDRCVILVDDGVATGASAMVANDVLRHMGPRMVVLAVPVVPADRVGPLKAAFDEVVYLAAPKSFRAVGEHYERFPQVTDEEVRSLLADAASLPNAP